MNPRVVMLVVLGGLGGIVGAWLGANAVYSGGFRLVTLLLLAGVVAMIIYALSGNKSVRSASAEEKRAALARTAPPGRALVFVFRQGFVGKAAGMDLTLDGRPVAQLKSPRFTSFTVAPGAHELHGRFARQVGGRRPEPLRFTAASGETAIFRATVHLTDGLKLEQVSAAEQAPLRAIMAGMPMAVPDLADA